MELVKKIEALLFIAGKPLAYNKLASAIGEGVKIQDIKTAVTQLSEVYKTEQRGVQIVWSDSNVQMATHGDASALVNKFAKDEMTGELTKPSIETLTIIAYRGPIAKLDLERIRGVNCSLILRNLMLRGLVTEQRDAKKKQTYYIVTLNFLKHLGLNSAQELSNYEKLHNDSDIDKFLAGEV